jgi:hypothetical protein
MRVRAITMMAALVAASTALAQDADAIDNTFSSLVGKPLRAVVERLGEATDQHLSGDTAKYTWRFTVVTVAADVPPEKVPTNAHPPACRIELFVNAHTDRIVRYRWTQARGGCKDTQRKLEGL